jgi:hypothetical protein
MFGRAIKGIISYYQDKNITKKNQKYNAALRQVTVGFLLILLFIETIFVFVIFADPHI